MNLLTIARRADFGYFLTANFEDVRSRLKAGASYRDVVKTSVLLDKTQTQFHEFTYLTGLASLAEAMVFDSATAFLSRYPGHLTDKGVPLATLAEAGSIGTAVEALAMKAVNDWSYGRFSDLVKNVIALYDKKASLDTALIDDLSEIKATRDLFVHANGKVNRIYLSKAGAKARSTRVGENIALGDKYLQHVEQTVERFIAEFEAAIPSSMKTMGRTTTFRAMWEATVLEKHVPFDSGWKTENENMVRPIDTGLAWSWSHSEQMLVDFFIGIYSEDYPTRKYDLMSALRRWPPATNEGKVIMSWFDSPFWF